MEQFDKIIAVNLRGVALCYKYGAKQMIAQKRGGRLVGTGLEVSCWLPRLTRVSLQLRLLSLGREAPNSCMHTVHLSSLFVDYLKVLVSPKPVLCTQDLVLIGFWQPKNFYRTKSR